MKHLYLIFTLTVITHANSQEKLEIDGAIVIKNSEDPSPTPGTIRWTGTDFLGWNGSKWISLTSGVTFEGEVTNVDGNKYQTIKIGSQEWMAENLRTTRYANGEMISAVNNYSNWGNANYGAWCWYDTSSTYELPYGKLYNWYAVNDGRGLCPTGWHEPSGAEWNTLLASLGGDMVAGGPMKATGTAHWIFPNTGATNDSGFSGLPGGLRLSDGSFSSLRTFGGWWSSSESDALNALYYGLENNDVNVVDGPDNKEMGLSVRCLKN